MYYILGQACVANWGSFALLQLKIRPNVVTNWDSFIITNWGIKGTSNKLDQWAT